MRYMQCLYILYPLSLQPHLLGHSQGHDPAGGHGFEEGYARSSPQGPRLEVGLGGEDGDIVEGHLRRKRPRAAPHVQPDPAHE